MKRKVTLIITMVFIWAVLACAAKPNPIVEIKTSLGTIEIELYALKAPETVKNFLKYVDSKFYNGTIFHRVINDFMIQGGGFLPGMHQKKGFAPIKNEATNGLKNNLGTISMARTMDVHSATSQFFINIKDNNFLDYLDSSPEKFGYCVFGKVVKGMDVVDKIKNVSTGNSGYFQNVPVKDVIILSAKRK